MSWLSQLPEHPIFSLPLSSPTSPSSTSTLPSRLPDTSLAYPTSPKLPSIFPQTSSSPSTPTRFNSSSKLATSTPASASSTSTRKRNLLPSDKKEPLQYEEEKLGGRARRNQRIVTIRGGTELIVAVGKELRICNLKEVKAKATSLGNGASEPDLGDYKVLNVPEINFEISQLVVNQSSKLLAVVGDHSIRVVELPRKGWTSSASDSIDVRCLEIGKFYHSLPGSSPIVQTLFHPFGQHYSSLLVLTEDAILREYTLHESSTEPSQTLSFSNTATTSKGGKGFFSADEESSREVSSMCFGDMFEEEGEGTAAADWGRMTVYGLFKNGDVKSICPFLPKRSSIPKSYLQGLSSFVSTKLDYLSSSTSPSSSSSALISSSKSSLSRSTDHPDSSPSLAPPTADYTRDLLEKRYSLQLQYLQTLLRQIPPTTTTTGGDEEEDGITDEVVSVTAPISRPNLAPKVQGPFLLVPSTIDLDETSEEDEPIATDLVYLSVQVGGGGGGKGDGESKGLGVLGIVHSDGKMEVCLEVEKSEARFAGEDTVNSTAVVVRGRRNEEEEVVEEELPMLLVYETIDLGFSTESSTTGGGGGGGNSPVFKRDGLYGRDTVWIYSRFGVECFVLGKGIESVWENAIEGTEGKLKGEEEGGESQVYWIVKTHGSTTTRKEEDDTEGGRNQPIVGLETISDVYLGYSIISITPLLQLVGIELSLRVGQDLLPSVPTPGTTNDTALSLKPTPSSPSFSAYVSLLDTPFTLPACFAPESRTKPLPLPSTPATSKEITITPDSLRQLGKQVESYQTCVRELVQGADTVQHRLELQMKELSRQLTKLEELKRMSGDLRESTLGTTSSTGAATAAGGLVSRMNKVEENQVALLERLDRVLQRLMESHQGQDKLSQYEKKWFDELGRMEKQVKGGLEPKAKRVEAMWEELRPGVEEMAARKKQLQLQVETPLRGGGLGRTQIKGLESKLSEEAKLLSDAKKKVERLVHSLAVTSLSSSS